MAAACDVIYLAIVAISLFRLIESTNEAYYMWRISC